MDDNNNVTENYTDFNNTMKDHIVSKANDQHSEKSIILVKPIIIGIDLYSNDNDSSQKIFMNIISHKNYKLSEKSDMDNNYDVDENRPRIKLLLQSMNM